MIVTNIKWITDGWDIELPTQLEVADGLNDEEIANYISDIYGWHVDSFSVPMSDDDIDEFGLYVNEVEGRVS